jgi:hypothetical protein
METKSLEDRKERIYRKPHIDLHEISQKKHRGREIIRGSYP